VLSSDVGQINEIALRQPRLVLGWATVSGSTPAAGNLSRSNQLPRPTQPGHSSVGRRTKGGDRVKAGMAHV